MRNIIRAPHGKKLIFFLVLTFFWYSADAVLTYLTPVLVETREPNLALLGIIVSMGSVAGIAADLVCSWLFSDKHYTFFYIAGFIIALLVPLLLPVAGVWPVILLIMIGGIQYELFSFGQEDYLGHHIPRQKQIFASGLVLMVITISGLVIPLTINSYLEELDFRFPFLIYIILMTAGFLYFFLFSPEKRRSVKQSPRQRIGFLSELKIWTMLTKKTAVVFIVMVSLMFLDAIFWTLGPLLTLEYAERSPELAGLFIPMYMLPGLFVGLYAPKLGMIAGELRAAVVTLLIAGVFLLGFMFTDNIAVLLVLNLLSSIFSSATAPLVEGVLANLINRLGDDSGHLIGLRGFATDIGYIAGPVFAGVIAQYFSIREGFVYLGLAVVIISVMLLIYKPKPIRLPHKELHRLEES